MIGPTACERWNEGKRDIMGEEINGEAGLFTELRKLSSKVTGGLLRMRQEAYRDGTVAAKHKLLTRHGYLDCDSLRTLYPGLCEDGAC